MIFSNVVVIENTSYKEEHVSFYDNDNGYRGRASRTTWAEDDPEEPYVTLEGNFLLSDLKGLRKQLEDIFKNEEDD